MRLSAILLDRPGYLCSLLFHPTSTSDDLSHLPVFDQLTQRLIPYRPLPKLILILGHQQITHHARKHDLPPRVQMRSISPCCTILTPVVCIGSVLTDRVHVRG